MIYQIIKHGILTGLGLLGLAVIFVGYCAFINKLVSLTVNPWLQLGIIVFGIGFLIGIAWNLGKIL